MILVLPKGITPKLLYNENGNISVIKKKLFNFETLNYFLRGFKPYFDPITFTTNLFTETIRMGCISAVFHFF